jgi:hypothetical protein
MLIPLAVVVTERGMAWQTGHNPLLKETSELLSQPVFLIGLKVGRQRRTA